MFFKAKYIIIDGMTPIVFPETLSHADVKRAISPGGTVTGAGFVNISSTGSYSCYGDSYSLKVKSNLDKDSIILNRYLAGNCEDDSL